MFEAAVKAACSACTIIYNNADQDAAKQQQQAESALTQGANVLVLDAVDGKAAAGIVASAKAAKVPVVAYDRFVASSDYYVSFDNQKVGQLQGQALVDTLKKAGKTSGNIVMINGSPTDANAGDFKKGAFRMAKSAGVPIIPIVVRNADDVAARDSMTVNPGVVDVAILAPISVADWDLADFPDRIAEVQELYVETLRHWPHEGDPRV